MVALMRSRLFWRRSAAAAGIYASAALGFLGTVVAAPRLLDGGVRPLRARACGDGLLPEPARPHRRGGARQVRLPLHDRARTGAGCGGSSRARSRSSSSAACSRPGCCSRSRRPRTRSCTRRADDAVADRRVPAARAGTENVGGVALILRGRYDVRAFFLFVSMALRLTAIAVGAPARPDRHDRRDRGRAGRRDRGDLCCRLVRVPALPAVASAPLGDDRRGLLSFVAQSTVATGRDLAAAPLSLLVLGRVASTRQVAFFRAAMSPQQAFAVVSAPARLILLTEQTRDWERGTRDAVFAGIRRYMAGMAAVSAVILVPLLVFMPELAKLLFSAKNAGAVDATRLVIVAGALRLVFGWTKSFPVSIGRPGLRIWSHGLEMVAARPAPRSCSARAGARPARRSRCSISTSSSACVDRAVPADPARAASRRRARRSCAAEPVLP